MYLETVRICRFFNDDVNHEIMLVEAHPMLADQGTIRAQPRRVGYSESRGNERWQSCLPLERCLLLI